MEHNYPPGPMTGRGGPGDDGCPCKGCPGLDGVACDCDLEVLDDEGLGGLPPTICPDCGCCREHCHCYDDEED